MEVRYPSIWLSLILLLCLYACKPTEPEVELPQYSSKLIAEVGNHKLYEEQLLKKAVIHDNMSEAERTQATNAYVQKWVKDQLMLIQAESVVANNLNINELVEDYRRSLILLNYEQKLIQQRLDTIITDAQIDEYYQEHGSIYTLSEPLVRCQFAKVRGDKSGIEKFYNQWKAGDAEKYTPYLEKNADLYMLDEDKWYTADEILNLLPSKISMRSLKRKSLQTADEGIEYFVNFLEFVDENEDPPLSYMSSNIKKILLHDRKVKLLNKIKQDLYEKEINTNKVKLYQ